MITNIAFVWTTPTAGPFPTQCATLAHSSACGAAILFGAYRKELEMRVTDFRFSNLRFWAKKDLKKENMFMIGSSKVWDEFWDTLGPKSSESKTHRFCFASQKCCELHFDFNEKFKECQMNLNKNFLHLPCTFPTWISNGLPVSV